MNVGDLIVQKGTSQIFDTFSGIQVLLHSKLKRNIVGVETNLCYFITEKYLIKLTKGWFNGNEPMKQMFHHTLNLLLS